jgi:hypothetical protein
LFRIGNCPCVSATEIDPQTKRVIISGSTANIGTVDTVRSTTNPSCGLNNGFGIWYKIKPYTYNANLFASTCFNGGTNFDTVITVYQGDSCRPKVCVKQNDENDDVTIAKCSFVDFTVSQSTAYWIFVDGAGAANAAKGNFTR